MSQIELLAPAGDMESLKAAVENGADAVYIGGKSFSARQHAGNFDDHEMLMAIEYCHIRGVKVYVTLNILLKDAELVDVPSSAAFLYNAGVDALIIQDLGVGKLISKVLPEFELHASTQITAHNLEGVNMLYDLGYKRVVLSRELSFDEIKKISSNTKAEIEVFVHGALCICYSGQCLMSSVIGGRSGNRGRCAQPCRMKYDLTLGNDNKQAYMLSPKDLSTVEYIGEVIDCKVSSLKVEGRMKKPEYVAAVISTYRKAIDKYLDVGLVDVSAEDKKNLLMAFNRGGFTTAHLFGKAGVEMMSLERPKNWGVYLGTITGVYPNKGEMEVQLEDNLTKGDGIEVWTRSGDNPGYVVRDIIIGKKPVENGNSKDRVILEYRGGAIGDKVYKTMDKSFMEGLTGTYKSHDPKRKSPLRCKIDIERDKPSCLVLSDDDGNTGRADGPVPENAEKVPLSEEKLTSYISKTGGTPFYIQDIDFKLDPGLSLPASAINTLRREAIDAIEKKKIDNKKPSAADEQGIYEMAEAVRISKIPIKYKEMRLSVLVRDLSLIQPAIDGGADIIIFGGDMLRGCSMDYIEAIHMCREKGVEIYLASPRIMKQEFDAVMTKLYDAMHSADGFSANLYADNLGAVKYAIDRAIPFASGFSLNTFNHMTASVFNDSGSRFLSLSLELSLKDIKSIAPYFENCEALCYGRIEMMVSEYCPIGALSHNCGKNEGRPLCMGEDVKLIDRMNMRFPIRTDAYCRSHIFNSKLLSMIDNLKDLKDAGINIFRLNMLEEDGNQVYDIVRAFKESLNVLEHRGNGFSHSTDSAMKYINEKGYTKGHYYRGVE